MSRIPEHIVQTLRRLENESLLRRLPEPAGENLIDFSSNDYLGLARMRRSFSAEAGSSGSRLLSGNAAAAMDLEQWFAQWMQSEASLLFNSGYHANLGILSAVPDRHSLILYDERCHASLKDGIRLSFAQKQPFRHQDLADLERRLQDFPGDKYIVTESIFSMDGDICPLPAMAALAEKHGAFLILDEAHALGIMGPQGRGLAAESGCEDAVFARIFPLGKAAGATGAMIAGPEMLIRFLINKARTFVYTTALPPFAIHFIRQNLQKLSEMDDERKHLQLLIRSAHELLKGNSVDVAPVSAIIPVIITGNEDVRKAAALLQDGGLDVKAVLSPTVKAGTERLRICLHAFNTSEQILALSSALSTILS